MLAKVARWDPDKAWLYAVGGTRTLKEAGLRPLLISRGGSEAHGVQVRRAAHAAGLRWIDRNGPASLEEGPGRWREIRVELTRRKDLVVRSRLGYYSDRRQAP